MIPKPLRQHPILKKEITHSAFLKDLKGKFLEGLTNCIYKNIRKIEG
jgi:hypothetical protein